MCVDRVCGAPRARLDEPVRRRFLPAVHSEDVSALNLCLPRSCKHFWGLSASHGPLSDEDDDVALLSVEMEPGEITFLP